ncbi:hypothetical protein AVEN_34287-1 [Araneus ventricosus]|uniref:Uncharacterized protein n=1 Tax=Araneus ventricosus TaxID=182803 RepID=A0A4Y2SSI5_ARAVE|nr:hypothetical protein AVEN_34287-1 [Araneus ventricosus]
MLCASESTSSSAEGDGKDQGSVASDDQDVILITETWLCEDIDSLELFDDRYLVFRRDRGSSTDSCRRGGGVLIAVKKCFNPCILDLPGSDLEAVWL